MPDKLELINLPPEEAMLPIQASNLLIILAITKSQSMVFKVAIAKLTGTPKYFIGKEAILHRNISAW